MKLTFNAAEVRRLYEHAFAAPSHSPTWTQLYDPACRKDGRTPDDDEQVKADDVDQAKVLAGLWLVGDNGVYLMSNGEPGLMKLSEPGNVVAFALECNPETMAFDDWWEAKRASFGGDDGSDVIDGADVEKWLKGARNGVVEMEITPDTFELVMYG